MDEEKTNGEPVEETPAEEAEEEKEKEEAEVPAE